MFVSDVPLTLLVHWETIFYKWNVVQAVMIIVNVWVLNPTDNRFIPADENSVGFSFTFREDKKLINASGW